MDKSQEHPDHERARLAGRVSPDHGEDEDSANRRRPTPGHPTVILHPDDLTGAQIGPGGLGDLVPPEQIDHGDADPDADRGEDKKR